MPARIGRSLWRPWRSITEHFDCALVGKKSKAKKIPKIAPGNQPNPSRDPKVRVPVGDPMNPVWRIAQLDWDGPWCPSRCQDAGVREILIRLAGFETMSWTQIQSGTGSHFVAIEDVIKEARQRLIDLRKEDWADNLFSLRMSNKERIWGFLRSGVLHLLWWDPEHKVCPSHKKNT